MTTDEAIAWAEKYGFRVDEITFIISQNRPGYTARVTNVGGNHHTAFANHEQHDTRAEAIISAVGEFNKRATEAARWQLENLQSQ